MAGRKFELPRIQDLSKEQLAVRALPKEGQHLIIGGPGTGKSVLALLRAKRHSRDGDDYVYLVFNHLLHEASKQLFGKELVSQTIDSWFRHLYRDLVGQTIPLHNARASGYRPINWSIVEQTTEELKVDSDRTQQFLLIDEGQDMPWQFYHSLVNLGFSNFFVTADQNQQITENNSSRQEITDCLGMEAEDVIELHQNFRNTDAIARLSKELRTIDPASPPINLPSSRPGETPLLRTYNLSKIDQLMKGILSVVNNRPKFLVGVITPNNNIREFFLDRLCKAAVRLQWTHIHIQTYFSQQKPAMLTFNEGGIIVINMQSCKGLEFDVVVLADIDEYRVHKDDLDKTFREFYVMSARAKKRLHMLMKKNGSIDILEILPNDSGVLERKEV